MAKILLVEDDSNLREIYSARLGAEGYEIFSANDGEEALAIAMREKPDLIISDVMMPKISGFDMLDILRATPETKDVKIIMMTALSQDEDRQRGVELGADHYIVKSQVTLDEVIIIVKQVLESINSAAPKVSPEEQAEALQKSTDDSLTNEIEQFVSTSPLMNGVAPEPSSQTEDQQPPTTPPAT